MLKFESRYHPAADEHTVLVSSTLDSGPFSTAMIAVFTNPAAADELVDFFNFLAQGFARYQIEHAQPDTSPSKA